jgi:hypothetical protein
VVLVNSERRPHGITTAQLLEARRNPMLEAFLYGLAERLPVECIGTHVPPDYNGEVVVRPPVAYGPSLLNWYLLIFHEVMDAPSRPENPYPLDTETSITPLREPPARSVGRQGERTFPDNS